MNPAILSEESMRTSWAALRNGCYANHTGYQFNMLNKYMEAFMTESNHGQCLQRKRPDRGYRNDD